MEIIKVVPPPTGPICDFCNADHRGRDTPAHVSPSAAGIKTRGFRSAPVMIDFSES